MHSNKRIKYSFLIINAVWFIGLMIMCVKLQNAKWERDEAKIEKEMFFELYKKANSGIEKCNRIMNDSTTLILYHSE